MTASVQQVYLPLQFNQILELVRQLSAPERQQLLLFLLGTRSGKEDVILTHLASERSLAQDWLTTTEEEAWEDL